MSRTIKLRVIEHSSNNYNHLELHILEESNVYGLMGSITPIGAVTFQQNKGETDWYGMSYVVNTNRVKELEAFAKIARKINDSTNYRSQPEDVIRAIKAVKMYLYKDKFFRESDKGKYCFKIYADGQYYWDVVGKDLIEAQRKLDLFLSKSTGSGLKDMRFIIDDGFLIQ